MADMRASALFAWEGAPILYVMPRRLPHPPKMKRRRCMFPSGSDCRFPKPATEPGPSRGPVFMYAPAVVRSDTRFMTRMRARF